MPQPQLFHPFTSLTLAESLLGLCSDEAGKSYQPYGGRTAPLLPCPSLDGATSPPICRQTFHPSPGEVKRLVSTGAGNTIPVYADIAADLLTPVSAYLKLSKSSEYSFLLESVAGGEKIGRYSLLGACKQLAWIF